MSALLTALYVIPVRGVSHIVSSSDVPVNTEKLIFKSQTNAADQNLTERYAMEGCSVVS